MSLKDTIPLNELRHHMILPPPTEAQLSRIERGYSARDTLAHHGINYSSRVLFHGPTGCGKKMAAERIAFNTGLRFLSVKRTKTGFLEVQRRQGNSDMNLDIAELLETVAREKGNSLLFIDIDDLTPGWKEKEAIEIGMDILYHLDQREPLPGEMIVMSTNVGAVINYGQVRGIFDCVVRFAPPSEEEVMHIILSTLHCVDRVGMEWLDILDVIAKANLSTAKVRRIAEEAATIAILENRPLMEEDIWQVLQERGLRKLTPSIG